MSPEPPGKRVAGPRASSEDAELLSSSPFADDLDATLAARPQRRSLPGPTLYLAAGIILVAGFLGGVQAQKWSSDGSERPAGGFTAGRPQGGYGGMPGVQPPGNAPGPGGFAGSGDTTTGTVVKVTGDTLYLRTTSGQTVKVATSEETRVRITKDGDLKNLASGANVTVRGTKAADGTLTATTVNQGAGR